MRTSIYTDAHVLPYSATLHKRCRRRRLPIAASTPTTPNSLDTNAFVRLRLCSKPLWASQCGSHRHCMAARPLFQQQMPNKYTRTAE